MTLAAAIEEAHWPHEFDQRDAALRRLAFDELLAVQLSLVRRRRRRARGSAPKMLVSTTERTKIESAIRSALTVGAAAGAAGGVASEWTSDQKIAIDAILGDLQGGADAATPSG